MKAEMEMAMKLLEKDVHEKQDTIISLRNQLEDIKNINLEMYEKLQVMIFFDNCCWIVHCDVFYRQLIFILYIISTNKFILGVWNRNKPKGWACGEAWNKNSRNKQNALTLERVQIIIDNVFIYINKD